MNHLYLRPTTLISLLLAALFVFGSALATTETDENVQTVNGLKIYLGFMPAQTVKALPANATESGMHDGSGASAHGEHIIAALFDAATGKRITDAHVEAAVGELGCGDTWKRLEPMRINNTVTYGNYFDMQGQGRIYEVHLRIDWPGHGPAREALFRHRMFD